MLQGFIEITTIPSFMNNTCFTVIGLVFDIVGASVLIYDGVKSGSAIIRQCNSRNPGVYLKWYQWIPIQLSHKVGSNDPQDTQEYVSESVVMKFWGLIFLILGFMMQALGLFLKW